MAAQSDVKLDKQTPDSKWKEILSAEEVCKIFFVSSNLCCMHMTIVCGAYLVLGCVLLYWLCLQYHILRQKGTEGAGTGKYNKMHDDGVYKCGGCGTPLYKYDCLSVYARPCLCFLGCTAAVMEQ